METFPGSPRTCPDSHRSMETFPGSPRTCPDSHRSMETFPGSPRTCPGSHRSMETFPGSPRTCPGSPIRDRRIARQCRPLWTARHCGGPSCSDCSIPCSRRFARSSVRFGPTRSTDPTMDSGHSVHPGSSLALRGLRPDRSDSDARRPPMRPMGVDRSSRFLPGAENQRECAVPSRQSTGR
jgi:hypothetical protein